MKQAQFNELVARLERYAARRPFAYKLRVALLAALGYGYVFLVLAVVLALISLLAWGMVTGRSFWAMKIEIIMIVFAGVILRALWVQFPRPVGIKLRREQLPEFFALLDELVRKLRAPRFSYVLLTNDFNAAIVQRPLLGVFGLHENFLLLGLPLMEALPAEQFRAVIAHELGHLSGNHSRFMAWIYRVRQTWIRLALSFQSHRNLGARVFNAFLRWYAPFFNAYSFVLARAQEYEADRCAAELTSPAVAAAALVNVQLHGRLLEQSFWPRIHRQVREQSSPPANLFTGMFETIRTGASAGDASHWLRQALAERTGNADTHPSLSDRLAALGQPASPTTQPRTEPTAAEAYLGDRRAKYAAAFDERWQNETTEQWRQQHEQAQSALQRLAELHERSRSEALSVQEAWERVCLAGEFEPEAAAESLLESFLQTHADHAGANFAFGRMLLERGDERGVRHVEKGMTAQPEVVLPGCLLLAEFLRVRGRTAESEAYRKRAEQHQDLLALAEEERATVTEEDTFEAHGLPEEQLAGLKEQLAKNEWIGKAFLLQKVVKHFPERPVFALVVVWNGGSSDSSRRYLATQLAKEIRFDWPCFIFVTPQRLNRIARKARSIPKAQIFSR